MRLFIALEFDRAWHDALEQVQRQLKGQDEGSCVRWVRPEGIHLTLRFLGEVEASQVASLVSALEVAAERSRAPRLAPGRLGAFPNRRRPRVIWIGLHEAGAALGSLQLAVETAVGACGWEPERRPFRPHLTLGRVRDPRQGVAASLTGALASEAVPSWEPRHEKRIALMRSHLSREGARYEALHTWKLRVTE